MQKNVTAFSATAAIGAVALLAACSSGSQGGNTVFPTSSATQHRVGMDLERSGVAPKFFSRIRSLQSGRVESASRVSPAKKRKIKELYVDDVGNNAVEILNYHWTNTGSITNGIEGPDGNFVDKAGNLYVANYAGITITEYAPHSNTPSFTYSAGMTDPINVSVDSNRNVYEADYNGKYVNEYAQHSNSVLASCSPGGYVEGVAVDKNGDVFVAANFPSNAGIVEYPGGLAGCNEITLMTSLQFAGGMVMDTHNNLVVCDQDAEAVDVLAPPYTSITATLGSGYSDPFHVTINKKNKQAYIAETGAADVQVRAYPSGAAIATLGSTSGLTDPFSAVNSQNFVP